MNTNPVVVQLIRPSVALALFNQNTKSKRKKVEFRNLKKKQCGVQNFAKSWCNDDDYAPSPYFDQKGTPTCPIQMSPDPFHFWAK